MLEIHLSQSHVRFGPTEYYPKFAARFLEFGGIAWYTLNLANYF